MNLSRQKFIQRKPCYGEVIFVGILKQQCLSTAHAPKVVDIPTEYDVLKKFVFDGATAQKSPEQRADTKIKQPTKACYFLANCIPLSLFF